MALCLSLPLGWVLEEEPTLEAVECARGPTGGPTAPPPVIMGQVQCQRISTFKLTDCCFEGVRNARVEPQIADLGKVCITTQRFQNQELSNAVSQFSERFSLNSFLPLG